MTLRTYKRVGFQKFRARPAVGFREGRVHLRRASPDRAEVIGWWPRALRGSCSACSTGRRDGLVVMRASDGLIVLVNEAFGRLLGLPVEGIVGHNSAEFGLWSAPAQRGEVQRSALADGARLAVESRLSHP